MVLGVGGGMSAVTVCPVSVLTVAGLGVAVSVGDDGSDGSDRRTVTSESRSVALLSTSEALGGVECAVLPSWSSSIPGVELLERCLVLRKVGKSVCGIGWRSLWRGKLEPLFVTQRLFSLKTVKTVVELLSIAQSSCRELRKQKTLRFFRLSSSKCVVRVLARGVSVSSIVTFHPAARNRSARLLVLTGRGEGPSL